MMYSIEETFAEMENTALSVPNSAICYGSISRSAFVWESYAEKNGMDFIANVVRFYENREWVDTWYPVDRATAQRLAKEWTQGSNEVNDRITAALA